MTIHNTPGAEVFGDRRKQANISVDLVSPDLRAALRVHAAECGLTYGALVRVLVAERLDQVKGVRPEHDYPTRERERFLAARRPGSEPEYPEGA